MSEEVAKVRYLSNIPRVYFIVSSKEGVAMLEVEHDAGGQTLHLPVYPEEGVTEALPFLTPPFAHFCSYWEKVTVPDPDETDARGFFVPRDELPPRIADPSNAEALTEIVQRTVPTHIREYYGDLVKGLFLHPPDWTTLVERNSDEFCVHYETLGIPPFATSQGSR